jgi:hypothetical protein
MNGKNMKTLANWRTLLAFPVVAALWALTPSSAKADTLYFLPSNTFSGTAPAGSLSASFTDVAGGVQLVITSSLASGENLDPGKALYLNINPAKSPLLSGLTFALTANTGFSEASSVMTGEDAFKADGDGFYDISFAYSPSTKAFTTGESQTYLITTSTGSISASDFTNFDSTMGGGAGTWLAAIHVQNTPSGGSGSAWVGGTPSQVVPEPSSLVLGLFGVIGFSLTQIRRLVRRNALALA